jgi:hypothetical protein
MDLLLSHRFLRRARCFDPYLQLLIRDKYVTFDGLCLAKRYFAAAVGRWLWDSCAPESYGREV